MFDLFMFIEFSGRVVTPDKYLMSFDRPAHHHQPVVLVVTNITSEYAVSAKLKLLRKLIMQEKNLTIYQTLKDTLQNWAKK